MTGYRCYRCQRCYAGDARNRDCPYCESPGRETEIREFENES